MTTATTTTTTTISRKLAKTLVAARTTREPVYFRRPGTVVDGVKVEGEAPTLEGLAQGDVVAVWQDGDRAPWIGTVTGIVADCDGVASTGGFVGVNGGERAAVRNIHSGNLYMMTCGRGMPKDLGLVAKIEKISL